MNRHYALLGLTGSSSLAELKTAYHRLAKKNHPDLFPDDQRRRQQLKMMRINEAYMSVMSDLVSAEGHSASFVQAPGAKATDGPASDGPGAAAGVSPTRGPSGSGASGNAAASDPTARFFDAWDVKARPGVPSDSREVGSLRDPAYSYYKAGFRYYNLGATELSRKEAPKLRRQLIATGTADGYILRLALRALHYFERSYSYFLVVVDKYPESAWSHDARYKLRRLEKFSAIYQRICENLSRRSSSSRSSFSMVNGADPS